MKLCSLATIILLALNSCSSTSTAPTKEEKLGTVYFEGGTQELNEGKYTEALNSLLMAVKYEPESAPIWSNLGLAYEAKQDSEKAKECWLKALKLDSDFSDARTNLGALYLSQGKYDSAEKEFKLILKDLTYTKMAQVYYNLALIDQKERRVVEEEQNLQLSVKSNKAYCPAWVSLGFIQKDRGETQAALESWHNGTQGPCYNNPEIQFNIAGLYAHLGDRAKAKAKYLEVIQLFPTSDWAKKAEVNLSLMR
jgi:Tfp pilus assembly protein PilF